MIWHWTINTICFGTQFVCLFVFDCLCICLRLTIYGISCDVSKTRKESLYSGRQCCTCKKMETAAGKRGRPKKKKGMFGTIHDLGIPPPPNSRRNSEGGEGSPHISCFKLSESCKIARTCTWTYVVVSWYHYCKFFFKWWFTFKSLWYFFFQRHLVTSFIIGLSFSRNLKWKNTIFVQRHLWVSFINWVMYDSEIKHFY